MEPRNIQTINHDEETDNLQLSSDVNGNEEDVMKEDEDIHLQQLLFYSAQFHSGKNLESSSSNVAGKKAVEPHHSFVNGSFKKVKGIWERGESSRSYCDICEDAFPPNTLIQGSSCQHLYCEQSIQNYITKKINDNIDHEVKCPIVNCKRTVDLELLLPYDVLDRVKDTNREAKALASSYAINCPYMDCTEKLIDDGKGFLISACPNCWRIFCVQCHDAWHMLSQMNFYFSRSGGYVVEHQHQQEEDS